MATLLVDTASFQAAQPSVGDVIAERYQIEEPIGHGGYGKVFRARHLATGQDVALKVLLPQAGSDDDFAIRRFFLEARVTSGLKHPHTVSVFDFGQEDTGLVYLAMELLAGRTLREALRERRKTGTPFTEAEAIEIGVAVLKSLGEAHAADLVHRDLKPDNVFLHEVGDDEPSVKVLDFGIAKLSDGSHTLSSTTSVPGTPAYMSPEHALNENVDGRSDLYSLGVILFQLVTLELPFRGPSDPQTLYMHAYSEVPDLFEHARTPVTEAFAKTISRALAKRPDDRFSSTKEMRSALRACSGESSFSGGSLAASDSVEVAAPMMTPHADSGMLQPIGRPSWTPWAYGAGALILAASGAALFVSLESPPELEPIAAPPPPPTAVAEPDAGMAPPKPAPKVEAEVQQPQENKKKRKKRKKRRRLRKSSPPAPPAPKVDPRKKRLLDLNVEDLD